MITNYAEIKSIIKNQENKKKQLVSDECRIVMFHFG